MIVPESPENLRLESDRRLAISVVAVLLALNLVFVIINLSESPNLASVPPVVVARLVGVLMAAIVTGALCWVRNQTALERVGFAGSMGVVALLLWIQLISPSRDLPGFGFDLVFIPTLFIAFPSSPPVQLIPASTLSIGAFLLLCRPESGIPDLDRVRYLVFFAAAISLGFIGSRRRTDLWHDLTTARQREWDAAVEADRAKSELQSLRGIIPICSHCHRVRIEDGRLWEAVDMYVSRRTDAVFSHGVCPDCLTVHYPNVRAE